MTSGSQPLSREPRSYVVTGGGRGVGRAVVERLLAGGHHVVALELRDEAMAWAGDHPAGTRILPLAGDASDEKVTEHAADLAESAGRLTGWVNNAAVFRDASIHEVPARDMLDLIELNLALTVTGCTTAIRRFLAARTPGAVVNISSHQAQRPVPGSTPYATAKAAVEGLTRALAVEYGEHGIRVNAVALGTIATERYHAELSRLPAAAREQFASGLADLHPLGRLGESHEAAAAITYLLGDDAAFVSGATLPVDGGRAVLAREPIPQRSGSDGT